MIISVINNKGGTGKTTTCVNLAAAFADSGFRVLVVDLDSQASASLSLGVQYPDLSPSIADALYDGVPLESVIRENDVSGPDLITGCAHLANSDLVLADVVGRETRLSQCLEPVRHGYDIILCDCPPSLSLLSVNALVASDCYLVPLTPEYLALEGLVSLMAAADEIKKNLETRAALLGIVLTMVTAGVKVFREIEQLVRDHYQDIVFQTRIRRNVKVNEAPAHGKSIFTHAPDSAGARDYAMLAGEVLERCGLTVSNGTRMD